MPCVVRCSFLLIIFCLGSMSWEARVVQVIKATGDDAIIECATDKTPQDGVYMYKKEGASEPRPIFYFYKDNTLTFKTINKSKATVSGTFPKLNVTLFHATAEDIGFYWCEFNLEEKITAGLRTWLWIEKEKEERDCPEDVLPHVKIFLILCAAMSLLCFIGFFCMILKMKGCWGNRKYIPSNPPPDSVYEEMKRSNLDAQVSVRTFINPHYQASTKLLR